MAEKFGTRMMEIRKEKRVTLRSLAEYVGKSVGYLSDIEHERKRPPELETVRKIEEFLGVSDGVLVRIASAIRKQAPKDLAHKIIMRPKLSEVLLRADEDLTGEEFDELIAHLGTLKKKREE